MCVRALRIASYSRVSYDEDKERYERILLKIMQKNILLIITSLNLKMITLVDISLIDLILQE